MYRQTNASWYIEKTYKISTFTITKYSPTYKLSLAIRMCTFYETAYDWLFAETTTSYGCNKDVKSWIILSLQIIRDSSYIIIGGCKKSWGYLSPKSLESQKIREVRDGEFIYIENYLNFRYWMCCELVCIESSRVFIITELISRR